ncbi:hypothetical protein PQJ75_13450 [Rhodoplanes sp. TEM]|uniref:Uncharacterized protein n=1 Tax=Rhodoplanes tepidamans TaxID=200616 RepID=A0ABT5JCN5_RHOTP|nr:MULTISPECIES: hypothetical protein [Rhodoplanes]MDC7787382.1 hypothetical protein [Rhodoplanes tepidamans]MDC7984736.1 hypothetical protein [Rhodoplanes sp. TEM]MDQ0358293.1 hypothetical protein [Rhodoplanes tepidamans]
MRMRRARFLSLGRSRLRIAAGVTASLVLLGVGLAMLPRPAATGSHARIGPEGTIRLAPDAYKQCQRLGFDNRNGEVRDRGVAACEPQAERDTSIDRMQAIRAFFNRR